MISWTANDDIQYGYGPHNSEGGKFDWDNQTIYLSEFNYLNNREIKLQGNLIEKINYSFPDTANQSIHIFDAHTTSSGDFKFNGKLYSAQITEGTEIIKDFIPVVDKNGVACLYDKVSGEFYYNKGTGNFTTGPRIEEPTPEPPATPEEPDTPDVPDIPSEPKPTPKPPTFREVMFCCK